MHLLPSLLLPEIQLQLLRCLLHRDLSDERHKTNLHAHYAIRYPRRRSSTSEGDAGESSGVFNDQVIDPRHASFFTLSPESGESIEPLDAAVHKRMSVSQFLGKKLRWITLGGQYDWTNKVYPSSPAPEFPDDIASLVTGLFPEVTPQAAIVNLYSPGDTLSMHRDVSENCDRGLVSISLGCDGLFIVGAATQDVDGGEGSHHMVLRLRSGDVLFMSGPSRYAWHAVPQIVSDTCPEWLSTWPAEASDEEEMNLNESLAYEDWRDWMATKRVNLNVRQMSV